MLILLSQCVGKNSVPVERGVRLILSKPTATEDNIAQVHRVETREITEANNLFKKRACHIKNQVDLVCLLRIKNVFI